MLKSSIVIATTSRGRKTKKNYRRKGTDKNMNLKRNSEISSPQRENSSPEPSCENYCSSK